jgi:diacylglycerol O-acyltransferase
VATNEQARQVGGQSRSAVAVASAARRVAPARLLERWWAALARTAVRDLWDVGVGLLVFGGYLLVASDVAGRVTAANGFAGHVRAAERWLHLDPEPAANRWTSAHPLVAQFANYHYAVGYLATTLAAVLWLRLTGRPGYGRRAAVLLGINAAAILVFWVWPVTPPRLLAQGGFVDTVEVHKTVGSWGSGLVTTIANQHAAMPSLHVAWATWVALTLLGQDLPRWLQRAGVLHIGTTTAVIVMTGNHWLLDAFAGAALAVAVELAVAGAWRLRRTGPGASLAGSVAAAEAVDGGKPCSSSYR